MEYVLVGVTLLGIGAWLTYWKWKRTFDRTNEYGVGRYPSYWRKVVSLGKDTLIPSCMSMSKHCGRLLPETVYRG
jgi:hypothetical protein